MAAQPTTDPHKSVAWNTQARTTAQESLRYTRFVGVAKRALLVAALAVLAAVVIYSMMPRKRSVPVGTTNIEGILRGDLTMEKPRLTGLDGSGNPYVVTADHATQVAHNTRRAHLFKIDADLTEKKDGTWINLHAPTGELDANAHTLRLDGPVDTFSDNGYEFHTMLAYVDLANGIVHGPRMAVGQGPIGNMRSDNFWMNRDKHLIVLNGNVRMTLYPNAMKKTPSATKPNATKPNATKKATKKP